MWFLVGPSDSLIIDHSVSMWLKNNLCNRIRRGFIWNLGDAQIWDSQSIYLLRLGALPTWQIRSKCCIQYAYYEILWAALLKFGLRIISHRSDIHRDFEFSISNSVLVILYYRMHNNIKLSHRDSPLPAQVEKQKSEIILIDPNCSAIFLKKKNSRFESLELSRKDFNQSTSKIDKQSNFAFRRPFRHFVKFFGWLAIRLRSFAYSLRLYYSLLCKWCKTPCFTRMFSYFNTPFVPEFRSWTLQKFWIFF